MPRMDEDWDSCTCHLVSYRIDIFYLLDGSSKSTRIITYFQAREHEKWLTIFFTRYFSSPSVCHKNLRFCWKLLWTIIYSLELEKLIITFFRKKWKNVNLLQPIYIKKYIDIHWYIQHLYIYINISIYRTQYIDILNTIYWYFQYIDTSLPSLAVPSCKYSFRLRKFLHLEKFRRNYGKSRWKNSNKNL